MTEVNVTQMKPGILVTEKVSVTGGVHYDREYETSYFDDSAQIRKWKTTARVDNVKEREKAQRIRTKVYQLIRSQCVKTPVGLICHKDNKEELDKAISQVRQERDAFNNSAKSCRMTTHHACFEVKEDNHQAISAIMDQIADVTERVQKAITLDDEATLKASAPKWLKGMKPTAVLLLPEDQKDAIVARVRAELIRKAISDIKGVETLLPKEAGDQTLTIVKKSRRLARELCKRVEKKSESLEEVLEEVDLSGLKKSRAAFVLASLKAEKRALKTEETVQVVEPRKLVIPISVLQEA